jgi:hypothetical protein
LPIAAPQAREPSGVAAGSQVTRSCVALNRMAAAAISSSMMSSLRI